MEWVLGLLLSIPASRAGVTSTAADGSGERSGACEQIPLKGKNECFLEEQLPGELLGQFAACESCSHSWSVFPLQEVPGAGPCWPCGAPLARLACHTPQPP